MTAVPPSLSTAGDYYFLEEVWTDLCFSGCQSLGGVCLKPKEYEAKHHSLVIRSSKPRQFFEDFFSVAAALPGNADSEEDFDTWGLEQADSGRFKRVLQMLISNRRFF